MASTWYWDGHLLKTNFVSSWIFHMTSFAMYNTPFEIFQQDLQCKDLTWRALAKYKHPSSETLYFSIKGPKGLGQPMLTNVVDNFPSFVTTSV